MSGKKENRSYEAEFALNSHERALFGATVTTRDEITGRTRTFARTHLTLIDALDAVAAELDALEGDWRVLTISSPVSIERDLYANRIQLNGTRPGAVGQTPEKLLLGRIKRMDLLASQAWTLAADYAGPQAAA